MKIDTLASFNRLILPPSSWHYPIKLYQRVSIYIQKRF